MSKTASEQALDLMTTIEPDELTRLREAVKVLRDAMKDIEGVCEYSDSSSAHAARNVAVRSLAATANLVEE